MSYTYVQAIGVNWPLVQCHAVGRGETYSDVVWDGGDALPDQATLDAWIAANPDPWTPRRITRLAFRNRFTQTEKVTLEFAALDNPAASMPERQAAAGLRSFMKDLDNASYVDLNRADTIGGVQTLVAYGLLTQERATAILNTPIDPTEEAH